MKHYVYELINSIDNKPFYVGKGSGQRMYIHEKRAKRSIAEVNENKKLRNKIRSILNNGGQIRYNQLFFTNDVVEAYNMESNRIMEIGLSNLCNRFIFPPTKEEIYNLISMRLTGHKTSESTKEKISKTLMGHVVKQSTREKIGNAIRGKKNPCSEARRHKIAIAKQLLGGFPNVISPSGQKYSIEILSDFCREHNLHLPAMSGLLKKYKNAKSHRGWKVYE